MPEESAPKPLPSRWRTPGTVAIIGAAALVMGAPSLSGGFLDGDDLQLIRNHVLVNHPSLRHALTLFRLDANRDLYQPIPLVSFAANFAVVHALGLTAETEGPRAGAWLFHLTNVVLHAVNAVLVWWLIARLSTRRSVPVIAALVFALHPLNVEAVGWLNGRMTLMSTLFALAALIAFDAYLTRRNGWLAGLCLVFVAWAMMSKVRIELPVLMLIPAWQRRVHIPWRAWVTWGLAGVITAAFVVVNLRLSRGMLEAGEETLRGSGLVRALLALGWYFEHTLLPCGLSPWYPAPNPARWSDPGLPAAVVIVVAVLVATLASLRWTRIGGWGLLWFLAAIAVVLPLVPSRNLLVANRYMYLPAIGLFWIGATLAVVAVEWSRRRWGRRLSWYGASLIGATAAGALLLTSWHNAGFYRNSVDQARRVAERDPDLAGVWERVARACYSAGRYDEALQAARTELAHHPRTMACDARHLAGMALYRMGRVEEGITEIRRAIAADPSKGMAYARLATIYNEMGQLENAVEPYVQAVERLPNYNPALVALGNVYVRLKRFDEARRVFGRALANNAYEVPALLGLADIDMAEGRYDQAAATLESLLAWMPENTQARSNLGVCYAMLGRRSDAIAAYRQVLKRDAAATSAALNLAALLNEQGDAAGAADALDQAWASAPWSRPVLIARQDFYVGRRQYAQAIQMWREALAREPAAPELAAWYAWANALDGQWNAARQTAAKLVDAGDRPILASATMALVALHDGQPESAVAHARRLVSAPGPDAPDVTSRLLRALEAFAASHPHDPFPYYVASMLLTAQGDRGAARRGLDVFKQLCPDDSWHRRADQLLIEPTGSQPAEPSTVR
jgi:tetratricopeptide (TPR) repeat protein